LGQPEQAIALWWSALDDDPDLTDAQNSLEEILRENQSWQALANLYLKLLAHFGRDSARDEANALTGTRLRLWVDLADLCWDKLGQKDSALDALEVACRLAPGDVERLRIYADRAAEAG